MKVRSNRMSPNSRAQGSGARGRGSAGLPVPPIGPLVQTKPNSGGRYAPLFHYSIVPAFQARARCAKQSQVLPSTTMGQVFCGKGVTTNRASNGPWKNKANFRESLKCQVPGLKLERPASSPPGLPASDLTRPTFAGSPGDGTTNVTDGRKRSCETKPIPGGGMSTQSRRHGTRRCREFPFQTDLCRRNAGLRTGIVPRRGAMVCWRRVARCGGWVVAVVKTESDLGRQVL